MPKTQPEKRVVSWVTPSGKMEVVCPNCRRDLHSIGHLLQCCFDNCDNDNDDCNNWGCADCFSVYSFSDGSWICKSCEDFMGIDTEEGE